MKNLGKLLKDFFDGRGKNRFFWQNIHLCSERSFRFEGTPKASVTINAAATCETHNVVYCISCKKCNIQYIGKTEREVKLRIAEHRGTINNEKLDKSVGVHFNKSGHRLSDFSFSVLEKCYKQCPEYLRKREEHWIQRFQTKFKGLNKIS